MNPIRLFFLKFGVLLLILSGVRWKLAIAEPIAPILGWSVVVSFVLSVLYPVGAPLYLMIERIRRVTTEATRFFLMLGTLGACVCAYRYWIHMEISFAWSGSASVLLLIGCIPPLANVLFAGWMRAARGVQFIVTRILLSVAYVIAVVPVGLLARISGKRFLQTQRDAAAASYWEDREDTLVQMRTYDHHF
ncbi:MAG TPA: hypothetical protein PKA91_03500 [Leptospiraceae bacterium]|nr:hypothetical protein [Leptospiraceae bacterium]